MEVCHENGALMSIQKFKKGKLVFIECWDEDNNKTITNCTGTYILKYPDGKKMSKVTYKNCKINGGNWINWDKRGNKISEFHYKEGKQFGEWKYWNENGDLIKIENY